MTYLGVFFFVFTINQCLGNLPFHLNFTHCDITQNGTSFPYTINAIKGHDIMVKLQKNSHNQERCLLRFPNFTRIEVGNNERIEKWSETCGVKIKKIEKTDEGMWRLISEGKTENIEGLFSLFVEEQVLNINENIKVTYNESDDEPTINFGNNSTYCYLTQDKETESTFIHGKCSLPIGKLTKSLEGNWKVKMGIYGSIDEEQSQSLVNVNIEEVDVGYIDNINEKTIHLYCNLKFSENILDFCRFERVSDTRGFHLSEGIGKDRYSYYGQGLKKNQCGITIKQPTNQDYGSWRCSIGFMKNDNSSKIFNRIMMVHKPASSLSIDRNGVRTILSPYGKELKITCNAGATIQYCTILHPNGTKFTPISTENDSPYKYDDLELDDGKCTFLFKKSSYDDNGTWTCLMGPQYPPGVEMIQEIQVRIGGELAAIDPILQVELGKPVNLTCITTAGYLTLKYCKFSPPNGPGFSVDETITSNKTILQQYYFKKGASLFRGDCAITIVKVSNQHLGRWTCSAMIEKYKTEYSDTLIIEANGKHMSSASVTGLIIGLILSIIILTSVGYYAWKRHKYNRMNTQTSSPQATTGRPTTDEVSIQYENRPSASSDQSDTQLTFLPDIHKTTTYGASTSTP